MNEIPTRQNSDRALRYLGAQHELYSSAKRRQGWQFVLLVPVTIAFSVATLFLPGLKSFAALYGFAMTLLDSVVVNPKIRGLKKEAARVQELFDSEVLNLGWNKFRGGRRPESEIVEEYSTKYLCRSADLTPLKDWYPPSVGGIPIDFARIICQRQNCWWDAKLRHRYAIGAIVIAVVATLIAFVASLGGGLTLEKFILVVLAPLMPIWSVGLRQYSENREAADGGSRLKDFAEELWEKALGEDKGPSEVEARALQDSIFDHRKNSPLIFDVARETGTLVLLVHHSGKSAKADAIDSPLGSTALGGAVSTLIVLRRTESYRLIQSVQRLGQDLQETVLNYDTSTHQLSLGGAKKDVDRADCEQAILEFLQGAGEPQTQAQIRAGVEGQTKAIRSALTALASAGRIIKTGAGTRGKPFIYAFRNTGSSTYSETRKPESQKAPEAHVNTGDILVPKDWENAILVPASMEPDVVFEEGEL